MAKPEEGALAFYRDLHRKAKSSRERLESDWYLNVSFYLGDQWIFWNRNRIDRPRLDPWRVTVTDNRMLPALDSRVARKVKNRPVFVVVPFSGDEEDRNAARLGEKILDHNWNALSLGEKSFRAIKWAELTGAGFWKIYWDKTKGAKRDFLFRDGQLMRDATGRPIPAEAMAQMPEAEDISVKSVAEGDLCIEVLSPFEIYPDPLAEDLDEAEWVIESKVRSPQYVKERYGVEAKPDSNVPTGIAESRMFPSSSTQGTSFGGRFSTSSEYMGVTLYEFWARPSSKYPHGKRAVWTQTQLLLETDLNDSPYSDNPYVMFRCLDVPGRFWPTSVATQLRGPQTELNKLRSQIVENAQRFGNPAMLTSRQANIKYQGMPGERINFDSTTPDAVPSYLQPPAIPQYIQNELERIEMSITEISGVHEVSKASVPSGVTAASAINLLQEADDTRLGPEIHNIEDAFSRAGTKALKVQAKFSSEERTLRLAGEEGDWEISKYKGTMLKNNTNVEVQAGSAMPRSKAARQAAMTEMLERFLQYGIQLDERALRKFFKEYDIGGLEHLLANVTNNETQVRREHQKMFNGIAVMINTYDDDDFHITAHEEEQKSLRYEQSDPQIQELLDMHVEAHRERRVAMIQQQLEKPPAIPQGASSNGNS